MVIVRPEQAGDEPAIWQVNRDAFGKPAEGDLVQRLREQGAVTLSLVAVWDEKIVGHILFSPVDVEGDTPFTAVALGPMAVHPSYQGQGIGVSLIRSGLAACQQMGEEVVFVLGHKDYYPRFGFESTAPLGITCEYDVPPEFFMALELREGALAGRQGKVVYQPAFRGV